MELGAVIDDVEAIIGRVQWLILVDRVTADS
jgi:hypothetical protein